MEKNIQSRMLLKTIRILVYNFFFSSRRRHTIFDCDWSSDVCSSDLRFWLFTGRRSAFGGRDRSGEYAILALQGPASGRILARLIGSEPVQALKYFHFLQIDNLIAARLGFSGELGYELMVPAAEASALREKLLNIGGVREGGWAAGDSLRIESGYVLFDREIVGPANPPRLCLRRLVRSTFEVC